MIVTEPNFNMYQKQILAFKQYRKTHPNISLFWITYLQNNIENYKDIIYQADKALNTLHNFKKDIPIKTMLILQYLFNQK